MNISKFIVLGSLVTILSFPVYAANPFKSAFESLKKMGSEDESGETSGQSVESPPEQLLLEPEGELRYKATVTKTANLRGGASTNDAIVVKLPAGTALVIAPKHGDWYQVKAVIDNKSYSGWLYHTLVDTQMVELEASETAVANPFNSFFSKLNELGDDKKDEAPATTKPDSGTLAESPNGLPVSGLTAVGEMRYLARMKKNGNMRSGPSTDEKVLGTIPEGAEIAVAGKDGNWYQAYAVVDQLGRTGWIYHSLVETDLEELPTPANGSGPAGQLNITHSGYSEKFVEIRELLSQGSVEEVEGRYDQEESDIRAKNKDEEQLEKKIGLLRWLERGTVALDQGKFDDSQYFFSASERLIEDQEGRSVIGGFFTNSSTQVFETMLGNNELGPYSAVGWEKILMLNYKSITYLLQGDRRAYNVTRRAIDWQNIEKKEFDKAVADAESKLKEEYAKKEAEEREKQRKDDAGVEPEEETQAEEVQAEDVQPEKMQPQTVVHDVVSRVLSPMDEKANSVASAYVNPFGYYVAGMVQEFESYSDRNLRDNARISYSKALELNPKSKVLAQAVEDMKSGNGSDNVNLVHVIVADGFVPEKKVLTYNLLTSQYGVLPLKLPIYESIESRIARVDVLSSSGKRLATLSTIADVEALCLRQQKDLQRVLTLEALMSTMVSGFIQSNAQKEAGWKGMFISLAGKVRDQNSAPDTRSWMSLPALIQATRLRLRKGVDKLKIVSYDKAGKQVASETVKINPNSHGVVYVRSMDGQMYTQVANKLWM